MQFVNYYQSPSGEMLMASDGTNLTGCWFAGQKYFASTIGDGYVKKELPVFELTKKWLDYYFSGHEPDFTPPIRTAGTAFQERVWSALLKIPYGQTTTYGQIAAQLWQQHGSGRVSARAVGGAVARNNISIIIPCHRVVGKCGSLTGYAGGMDKKIKLLKLEHIDTGRFFIPKGRTVIC